MDVVYSMPGQSHRLFINVVHACPNACYFCVDFKGDTFYGFDLKKGGPPSARDIIEAVRSYPLRQQVTEIYYCGIGEPLLRYDTVVETASHIRELFQQSVLLAINTSGTFYLRRASVDFALYFDLIQVSLNAENEEKYNIICRPKVAGAYRSLNDFLRHLRRFIDESRLKCCVELSVVDTSDVAHLPKFEHSMNPLPTPDIEACRVIASRLGWPLKVKTLIKDCEETKWKPLANSLRAHVNNDI